MSKAVVLSDRQKAALRPFVREAAKLEQDGFLRSDARMKSGAYFDTGVWLALLYAFESDV
jgi:hypothetical protein